jgi:hypothetical protein
MTKMSNTRQKWAAGILGVVCVALLINLLRSPYVSGGPSTPATPRIEPAHPGAPPSPASAALSSYEPEVQLERLSQINLRPLPTMNRNPFVYGPTPAEIASAKAADEKKNEPPPPPPPPPITVKALGFEQGPGEARKAFFADTADTPEAPSQTYQAAEGQSFADRYKVLKITSTEVTIEDQSSHAKAQLPFPD